MSDIRDVTRRDTFALGAGALASWVCRWRRARGETERHGISAFGDLKYPADFKHFDYVNPNAPRAARSPMSGHRRRSTRTLVTFNSLNSYILKGDAAKGMELTFATLMAGAETSRTRSMGSPRARAHCAGRADLSVPAAIRLTFHDGSPLSAHTWPSLWISSRRRGIRSFSSSCAMSSVSRRATMRPWSCGLFRGARATCRCPWRRCRSFAQVLFGEAVRESTLEPPLGSGGYKVGRFEAGRYIEYERVKDWWGTDLRPCAAATISTSCGSSSTVTATSPSSTAKNFTFWEEFTARIWATRYDSGLPRRARQARGAGGRDTVGRAGLVYQHAARQFKDRRVREALICAFDFEWTNKTIMYGAYERVRSVYQNSPMMAVGKPSGRARAARPFRGKVPDEVFGEPFIPPSPTARSGSCAAARRAPCCAGRLRHQGRQADDAQGSS